MDSIARIISRGTVFHITSVPFAERRIITMYEDDSDGFDLFLGLILWAPYIAWLWLKLTFMILEFVFSAVAIIGSVLYYFIKEIIGIVFKLMYDGK